MRTVDVFYAFPSCCWRSPFQARSARIVNSIVSLTIGSCRRSPGLPERPTRRAQHGFVEAARASGAALHHHAPCTCSATCWAIFVYATGLISVSMILAAGLSFLAWARSRRSRNGALMLNTLPYRDLRQSLVARCPGR